MKTRRAAGLMSNGTPTRLESPDARPQRAANGPHRFRSPRAQNGLVDTLAGTRSFRVLGRAIHVGGLAETLAAAGPFTLFAPTDVAFAMLPAAELDALLDDAPRLARVLTGYVVSGIVAAPRAGSPRVVRTLGGGTLEITVTDRGFRVNEAMVVKTELTASNGVIHAIDTVLMPR